MTSAAKSNPASSYERACAAAEFIRARTTLAPRIALVLGSGLGSFADQLQDAVRIPYAEIPYFPRSTAEGHAGQLVIGTTKGVAVAAMQGRVHYYEGHPISDVVFPMRTFGRMGVGAAILTNAAGGVNLSYKPGSLVVVSDHINLQGVNPLVGENDPRFGLRFIDLSQTYDRGLRRLTMDAGKRLGMVLYEGVYAANSGPSYETPAEIRYLRTIGADLVGMSTVPEAIVARHMGIRVLAISCVTNMAAGILDQPLSHAEVLETGEQVKGQFLALLEAVIPEVAKEIG